MYNVNIDVQNCANVTNSITTFTRGNKFFELANHLGNVLVTVSDKKIQVEGTTSPCFQCKVAYTGRVGYYLADLVTASDYYPFGMQMQGRKYAAPSSSSYRYGFNGKENDNEVKGEGDQQDYGMRIYDTRLGRFLSVDPIAKDFPWYTPYQFSGNTPIQAIDLDGEEEKHYTLTLNKNGSASLTNIPSKTKEYNEIPLWLRIITLGAGKSSYKIPSRAEVTYGSNTYKIGFASSVTNKDKMGAFNEILKNPNTVDPDAFTSTFHNEDQDFSVALFTFNVNYQNNLAMYGPLTSKAWYSHNNAPGSRKRLEAFLKFSPSWNKGSLSEALKKFAPGVDGVLSGDGVKTNYLNTKTNIEVMVDNENNYFRIVNRNKNQEITMDGKLPSTGTLKGEAAKNQIKSQTHYLNTDK